DGPLVVAPCGAPEDFGGRVEDYPGEKAPRPPEAPAVLRQCAYFRRVAAGRTETTTDRFTCGELSTACPGPSSGQRDHSPRLTSPVVAISASRLWVRRRVCTSRVLHSSNSSGGRCPGCWLTKAIASHRFRPRRVTFRSMCSVACIVSARSRL